MSRRRGWIWISLAILCALGAGGLSFYVLGQEALAIQQRVTAELAPTPIPVPKIGIPVAASDLQDGATISQQSYVIKEFPIELVPSNAITQTAQLDNQILIQSVAAGDIFRNNALLGGTGASVSEQITVGKTLIAVPAADLLAESGLIANGDHIDLLLTMNSTDGTNTTKITGYSIQNAQVFRILAPPKTESDPSPKPTGYILLLTPKDAVAVKATKDAGGTIDMALRSPKDTNSFEAPAVTSEQIDGFLRNGGNR